MFSMGLILFFLLCCSLTALSTDGVGMGIAGQALLQAEFLDEMRGMFSTFKLEIKESIETEINSTMKNMATKKDIEDLKNSTKKDIEDLKKSTKKDMEDLKKDFATKIEELKITLHDHNANTVKVLTAVTTNSTICDSFVTAHFVLYDDKIFGISVAHTPCYLSRHHTIPEWVVACPNRDVALWKGCPPAGISLLNITNSVANASLGDAALVFGYADMKKRSWSGNVIGMGKSYTGHHFTPEAYGHDEELLFTGAQDKGMSGGGAINGRGTFIFLCFFVVFSLIESVGYLGVARAVLTDQIGNRLPVITPLHLFEDCIRNNLRDLRSIATCPAIEYEVLAVPSFF